MKNVRIKYPFVNDLKEGVIQFFQPDHPSIVSRFSSLDLYRDIRNEAEAGLLVNRSGLLAVMDYFDGGQIG